MALVWGILIDGLVHGTVLFLLAVGLALTLGLLRVVNLAHGAFAMAGGYVAAGLIRGAGLPFALGLAGGVAAAAALALPVERLLLRRTYRRPELDQVLLTIGLAFVAIAAASWSMGTGLQTIPLPAALQGPIDLGVRTLPRHRLLVLGGGLAVVVGLWLLVERTRFGVHVRATVDDPATAAALGIDVGRVRALAVALGAGLAGLGAVLGAEILPLEPAYALRYLVLLLAVVAVGGQGTVTGSFVAAVLLGLVETAAKYLLPDLAQILFYLTMLAILALRPGGLLGRAAGDGAGGGRARAPTAAPAPGVRRGLAVPLLPETALAAAGLAAFLLFPDDLAFLTRVAIACLLALSLDLTLGLGGIVTLGHAALYGTGSYAAGLLALHLAADPHLGLVAGAAAGALLALLSGIVILRAHGLTLVMLTVAVAQLVQEAANKAAWLTGGDDGLAGFTTGPVLGLFRFDLAGRTGYFWSLAVLVVAFGLLRRLAASPFGLTAEGIRADAGRMRALGCPVFCHRLQVYTLGGAVAGAAGALSAQVTEVVGLAALGFQTSAELLVMLTLGGLGRLWGALLGVVVFLLVHHLAAAADPFHWLAVIGAMLILTVLVLPGGLIGLLDRAAARRHRRGRGEAAEAAGR